MDTRLMTKKELADLLQVSTRTLDRWAAMGLDLGAVKVRGVKRYRREIVERFIAKHTAKARGQPQPA